MPLNPINRISQQALKSIEKYWEGQSRPIICRWVNIYSVQTLLILIASACFPASEKRTKIDQTHLTIIIGLYLLCCYICAYSVSHLRQSQLSITDYIMLQMVSAMLSNKVVRLVVLAYSAFLHGIVFVVLMKKTMNRFRMRNSGLEWEQKCDRHT